MSLSTVISDLEKVPNIFALVDSAVTSVETSLAGVAGISSSAKLAAAEAKINGYLAAIGLDIAQVTSLGSVLVPLINAAVSIFNSVGLFSHSSAAPAPAAA